MKLNVAHATSAESLHEMLAAAFDFPGWYGKNWDAFRDCILSDGELSSLPDLLVIKGLNLYAEAFEREARIFKECLDELAESRPDLVISFEDVDPSPPFPVVKH